MYYRAVLKGSVFSSAHTAARNLLDGPSARPNRLLIFQGISLLSFLCYTLLMLHPARCLPASRSVWRALLTPQAKPGSLYHRGMSTLRAVRGPRQEEKGPEIRLPKSMYSRRLGRVHLRGGDRVRCVSPTSLTRVAQFQYLGPSWALFAQPLAPGLAQWQRSRPVIEHHVALFFKAYPVSA